MTTMTAQHNSLSSFDRTLLALGFVFSTGLTVGLNYLASDKAAEKQAVRSVELEQVSSFTKQSQQFEVLARAYTGDLLKHRDTEKSGKALQDHLQQQRILIQDLEAYLSPADRAIADRYSDAIVNVITAIDDKPAPESAGPLFQELEYIFDNKVDLQAALNRRVGLPAPQAPIRPAIHF